MNGYLRAHAVAKMLNDKAAGFQVMSYDDDFSVAELRDMMSSLEAEMVRLANVDLKAVALEVVRELGTNQKIQSIKAVRDRTGAGLEEAKDAVEAIIPQVIAEQVKKLLREYVQAHDFKSLDKTELF